MWHRQTKFAKSPFQEFTDDLSDKKAIKSTGRERERGREGGRERVREREREREVDSHLCVVASCTLLRVVDISHVPFYA